MTPRAQSLLAADQLVEDVKKATGSDYSKHRELIATQLYHNGIFNGNWDSSTNLGDPELKDLRRIQEDEYDQSMDEDDRPTWDSMICQTGGDYVWFA